MRQVTVQLFWSLFDLALTGAIQSGANQDAIPVSFKTQFANARAHSSGGSDPGCD